MRGRQRGFGGSQHVARVGEFLARYRAAADQPFAALHVRARLCHGDLPCLDVGLAGVAAAVQAAHLAHRAGEVGDGLRSHENTSERQSLRRISYADTSMKNNKTKYA